MAHYYAPKNFNFWYFFGSLALLVLVNQISDRHFVDHELQAGCQTGIRFRRIHHARCELGLADSLYAFNRCVGVFYRVYLHMFRGLLYGSFKHPRELIWIFGMLLFVALMAEAFMGYLLPWGQMSYWGAQVIISLFSAIPVIGDDLSLWVRGDYVVSDATLNRFFAFHVIAVPLVLVLLVFLHIVALA